MSAKFADSGTFVVRAPLLPYATMELDAGTAAIEAWRNDQPLDDAVAADRATLSENLKTLLDDPTFREALFLASPDLDDRVTAGDDVLRAVLSYVLRMATRSTPFGLFAGCGAGPVGGPTAPLRLPPREAITRHTRLDFGFLAAVVQSLANDAQTREALTYVPNSSLYRAGRRLRMAEARIDEQRRVRYHRVTFEEDEFLTSTLDRATGGATLSDLAAALVDDDVTIEEATEYVSELASAQLLVPRLGPPVTGDEPVPGMVAALRGHAATATVADVLADAEAELDALDAAGPGQDRARYRELAERLRKVDPDLRVDRLFQLDVSLGGPGPSLPDVVVTEVRRAVELLHGMARNSAEDDITRFRDAFRERYEDRVVPLAEALDEEVGIGFGPPAALSAEGAPLLAGVAGRTRQGSQTFSGRDGVLLKLLTRAIADGAPEVVLTQADLQALNHGDDPSPLPDALAASFVLARHDDDLRVVMTAITGPSGARLLGRFCHVDEGVDRLVAEHVQAEERLRPEPAFAEIVHLPEGRVGNVLARPVLRPYEIEFLGTSGADHERVLPLSDLLVTVVGDRVVVRSQRLDREVVPRLTNAHNHVTGALAPYRFLAALQYQGVAGTLTWSWGPLEAASYLPRVVSGRLVLSKARWQLSPEDTKELREAKTLPAKFAAAQRLRDRLRLPRRVTVAEGDHELPCDLDRVGGIELLAHEASKFGSLRLIETYPGPDELYAEREDGAYAHEVVLPMVRTEPMPAVVRPVPPPVEEQVFVPGSEWLTAKLYCGAATADTVLRESIAPLVREVVGDSADGWFFIRYADPDPHIRLRFTGDAARLSAEVLPAVRATVEPLLRDGVLRRVVMDSYRREVARYGGPEGILAAERFFRADSDAVLAILAVAGGDEGLDLRWRLAVAGVDKLLGGLAIADRREAVKRWRDGYVAEQGTTGESAKRRSGKLFRDERAALSDLLDGNTSNPALAAGLAALDARTGIAELPLETLGSHVHMHVNRMLRAAQRTQELVVLDLLDRLYAARLGRAKSGS